MTQTATIKRAIGLALALALTQPAPRRSAVMKPRKAVSPKSPLIRLVGLEVAVAATGIVGSLGAAAAPGDLDPSFGDVGRQSDLGVSSLLWSTEVAPDGSVFASGGGCEYFSYYYSCADVNFSSRLLSTGAIAADFLAVPLENSVVLDAARQADGRLVEVGRVTLANGAQDKMQVSRRLPDGTLDPGFGLNGKVWIDDGTTASVVGRSVIVDADQRIVVAGTRGSSLIVARLLPGGALDPGFATGGKYMPAATGANIYPPRVAAAPGGGYRVASNTQASAGTRVCAVTALGEAGDVDANFGQSGTASAPSLPGDSEPVLCYSMAIAPDGALLLGGRQGASAYLQRLRPDGSADPGFASGDVNSHLSFVRAIALPTGGKIYVTGDSRSPLFGAPVLRLDSAGTLDDSYGQTGIAQVAIQANRPGSHSINDLQPGPGDTLVVGGNAGSVPFVARLLGDSGPGGPGLLSLQQQSGFATESGQATLKVSRIGGSTGAVAVSYRARDVTTWVPGDLASGGADYTQVAGRLTWGTGDMSEREITVPVAGDTAFESPEYFEVVLEAAEGGAGLATSGVDVQIAGSSYPGGLVSMTTSGESITEGTRGNLYLTRSQYAVGTISVTVRVAGGTATPDQDFGSSSSYLWQDVVVTWPDGQSGVRTVQIHVRGDDRNEASESVQFELVAPTGGATLDPANSQVVMTIEDRRSAGSGGGGGGNFGWLTVALLGLVGLLRRLSRW